MNASDYIIYECSPKAKELIHNLEMLNCGHEQLNEKNFIYPFGRLLIGQSFCVMYSANVPRINLEMAARSHSKRHNVYFKVISHKEHQLFEVVRVDSDITKEKKAEQEWHDLGSNNKRKNEWSLTEYEIFDYKDISPKAQSKIADKSTIGKGEFDNEKHFKTYPFVRMRIGQAFYVKANEGCRHSLESCHRAFSKSHPGRYFRVIWHKSHQCYEVVRIK